MKITKVFTKYDQPIKTIFVPSFRNIEVQNDLDNVSDLTLLCFGTQTTALKPIKKEDGLEGVKFITYGDDNE